MDTVYTGEQPQNEFISRVSLVRVQSPLFFLFVTYVSEIAFRHGYTSFHPVSTSSSNG